MKKLIFSIFALFAFGIASAQVGQGGQFGNKVNEGQFKIGVNLGAPVGDANDYSSISFGVDAAYLWNLSEDFKAGATLGYLSFIGKKHHGEKRSNADFLPIAATGQYSIVENVFVGADLGYGIGLSTGNNGGFYYQPKLGYQIDLFEVYLGYRGIAKSGANASAISIGFNYKF